MYVCGGFCARQEMNEVMWTALRLTAMTSKFCRSTWIAVHAIKVDQVNPLPRQDHHASPVDLRYETSPDSRMACLYLNM